MKGSDEIMETTPVRIDNDVLDIVRSIKAITGCPIQRFVEEAIMLKVSRLPKSTKEKLGLKENKKKTNDKSK